MIARLRELWAQTEPYLSTAAIGRALKCSKSAAVGKAHRLHLPRRPDPIIRGDGTPPKSSPPQQKAPAAVLHFLPTPAHEPDPPAKPVLLPSASTAPTRLSPPWSRCHWPIGDTKSPDFRWCGERVAAPQKPYCPEHAALAYTRSRHDAA
jgi:GcrA cell cycle regulator